MTPEDLRRRFGDDYPAAISVGGTRMTLSGENRFARTYREEGSKNFYTISRFMDGSAEMTMTDLSREWRSWSVRLRGSFCLGCGWLSDRADFPDMLRFLMKHGDDDERSTIASVVAACLSQQEAFDLMLETLRGLEGKPTANVIQAIAATNHPDAAGILSCHLDELWKRPGLWSDHEFMNWDGFDVTCCIAHLIQTGAEPTQFEEKVRLLADHPCSGNRDSTRRYLGKYFDWLT